MGLSINELNAAVSKIVALLLVVLTGFYLAKTTWYWVVPEPWITPHHNLEVSEVVVSISEIPLKQTLDSLQRYNPWGELPTKEKVVEKAVAPKKEEAVVSQLNVELLGTMILPGQQSVAFLVDLGQRKSRKNRSGKQQMMYVGDQIQGAELEKIERNAVYLRNGEQLEIITTQAGLLDRKELLPDSLKTAKVNTKQISRAELGQFIDQGVALLRGLEITPHYQGRHAIGYRVNIIASRPAYQLVGLQSGDIIKSVNGISVMKTKDVISMVSQVRKSKKVQIDIIRGNQPQLLEITVDG